MTMPRTDNDTWSITESVGPSGHHDDRLSRGFHHGGDFGAADRSGACDSEIEEIERNC